MRKTKEVLRLRFELGLGQRQIARSCGIGLGTVHQYLERAVAAGIGWPLPADLGEEELEAKLFGNQPVTVKAVPQRPQPDWKAIHEQLQQHRHLTLQLVWEEYRQGNPEGYRYSWFCERYQHWRRHLDVVLRQEHKAGEKMFVDWAGATIPVYDASTGEAWPASLFVSVLGASSYTYAEATRDQQLEAWIQAHMHALEFFGGVPTLVVPDNTKTAVTRACRYDPDLNPTYQEFAIHYGMGVVPARPYKPRDKAKVESGVQICERWIIAALRNRKFFSLPELNQAIRELLVRLNQRAFRKRDGSRASLFHSLEKPALAPLTAERFDMGQRWFLFRSSQFVQNRTLDEIPQLSGRIHVLEVLDITTAAFEFAARMASQGLLLSDALITFDLQGADGRELTWPQNVFGDNNRVPHNCWCQEDAVTGTKLFTAQELEKRRRYIALEAAIEIYAQFGW